MNPRLNLFILVLLIYSSSKAQIQVTKRALDSFITTKINSINNLLLTSFKTGKILAFKPYGEEQVHPTEEQIQKLSSNKTQSASIVLHKQLDSASGALSYTPIYYAPTTTISNSLKTYQAPVLMFQISDLSEVLSKDDLALVKALIRIRTNFIFYGTEEQKLSLSSSYALSADYSVYTRKLKLLDLDSEFIAFIASSCYNSIRDLAVQIQYSSGEIYKDSNLIAPYTNLKEELFDSTGQMIQNPDNPHDPYDRVYVGSTFHTFDHIRVLEKGDECIIELSMLNRPRIRAYFSYSKYKYIVRQHDEILLNYSLSQNLE